MITSGGAWCGSTLRGEAPNSCVPLKGGVGFALQCQNGAKDCAALIAHEHGHLVGLAHEKSVLFLMQGEDCDDCDAFPNAEITVPGARCGRELQNSYRLMCERLGPRSKVPAPTRALTCPDVAAPRLAITAPAPSAPVLQGFSVEIEASDECGVRRVYTSDPVRGPVDWESPFRLSSDLEVGAKRLTAFAEDNHGNVSAAEFEVDVHPRECPRFPCRIADPL